MHSNVIHSKPTSVYMYNVPGWKGLCRARLTHDEIVHSRELHVHVLFYASATRGVMNEISARIPRVLHSISHLLCAVLTFGSATCNTENSMFVTPSSACVAHIIVVCGGVGRRCALRVTYAWFGARMSQISKQRWKRANHSTWVYIHVTFINFEICQFGEGRLHCTPQGNPLPSSS